MLTTKNESTTIEIYDKMKTAGCADLFLVALALFKKDIQEIYLYN